VRPGASDQMVAPVTGDSVGLRRAEIHSGVREIILCKDQDGKIGLRIQAVNKVSNSASRLLLVIILCTLLDLLSGLTLLVGQKMFTCFV